MTRVLRFHEHGNIVDKLKLESITERKPVADEVLIQVDAFALNRSDIQFVEGAYTTKAKLPSRLGSEVSGKVLAIGPDVKSLAIGDRVCTIPYPGNSEYGVNGEIAIIQEYAVTPTPVGLSAEIATSVWMQYLTAYFAFCEKVTLNTNDFVFFSAASGSAGLGAIQLVKMLGAKTIAATRTKDKVDFLLEVGADHVVVSEDEDVTVRILEITKGKGVRIAYDPVFGSYVDNYAQAMSKNGLIIAYGLLAEDLTLPYWYFWRQATNVYFYSMYNHVMDAAQLARGKAMIYGGLATGQLKPVIDRIFPLEQYLDAYRYMLSNTQKGKIVVRVSN